MCTHAPLYACSTGVSTYPCVQIALRGLLTVVSGVLCTGLSTTMSQSTFRCDRFCSCHAHPKVVVRRCLCWVEVGVTGARLTLGPACLGAGAEFYARGSGGGVDTHLQTSSSLISSWALRRADGPEEENLKTLVGTSFPVLKPLPV